MPEHPADARSAGPEVCLGASLSLVLGATPCGVHNEAALVGSIAAAVGLPEEATLLALERLFRAGLVQTDAGAWTDDRFAVYFRTARGDAAAGVGIVVTGPDAEGQWVVEEPPVRDDVLGEGPEWHVASSEGEALRIAARLQANLAADHKAVLIIRESPATA